MRPSPMMTRRRRIRVAITSVVAALIAVPAVAATCYEQESGGIGGSGIFGGKRMLTEMGVGETAAISCTSGKIKQVLSATTGVIFTCE